MTHVSVLYAVMDCSSSVRLPHLQAALAVWQYAEDSARYVFGAASGDPIADRILEPVRQSGEDGMSKTEILRVFYSNVSAGRIDAALDSLERAGKIKRGLVATGGRPREVYRAAQ